MGYCGSEGCTGIKYEDWEAKLEPWSDRTRGGWPRCQFMDSTGGEQCREMATNETETACEVHKDVGPSKMGNHRKPLYGFLCRVCSCGCEFKSVSKTPVAATPKPIEEGARSMERRLRYMHLEQ